MTDKEIVDLFFDRDEIAIKVSKEKYGERLLNLSKNILKNEESAKEVENDTYLRAWNSIPPARPEYLFAFFGKIARRLSFDRLKCENALKRKASLVELTFEIEMCIPDSRGEFSPEDYDFKALINSFLLSLEEEKRIIFLKRYWFFDSVEDISKDLKISQSKVKTSLYRTRNKLREYLLKEGCNL